MQFPESWLRALVNPDLDTQTLADTLTMAGLEVEDLQSAAPAFSGVVVAHITRVDPHPNADKLRVCRVDDGSGTLLQIVCGAPNVAADMRVPLARVGAVLPGGVAIATARMRGVESAGMLCSARELGLSEDHSGLLVLPADAVVGQDIRTCLDLDDAIFVLKLTPNRADCLSLLGVAREVSALTGAPLQAPTLPPVPVTLSDVLPVTVKAPDLCGRFAGRVVRGVNARAQTPEWMKTRLLRAGQRPISALVDISNYVMLELGRPTHVFDLDKVQGDLEVRWAAPDERITLLNGQTLTLTPDVGVIAGGGGAESLAGIMGGEATSVTLDTVNIYVEAAYWHTEAIMGRARRYKFSSEASHRFERGVDFDTIPEHLEYMTNLLVQICGGQVGPINDQVIQLPVRAPVKMRLARCCKVLGIPLDENEVAQVFTRLQLPFTIRQEGERQDQTQGQLQDTVFVVTPPAYRFDLTLEEDLIEEVARLHGFDRIPAQPPVVPAHMRGSASDRRDAHTLRDRMAAQDYQEVINFSFVEEAWERDLGSTSPIRLLNPIAQQMSTMRSSLIPGLIANIVHNVRHRQTRVRVFELGRVFLRDATVTDDKLQVAGVHQPLRLAAAAWGPAWEEQWGARVRAVDFYDIKKDLETLWGHDAAQLVCVAHPHPLLHPGRSARLQWQGQDVGCLGELHPRLMQAANLAQAPVVFEVDVQALTRSTLPQAREASRQPVVVRDLAIWVTHHVSYQDVLNTLHHTIAADAQLHIVRDLRLFDVWRTAAQSDEKSLALRFWLQDTDATLDDQRVEQCLHRLLDVLVRTHGARLRAQEIAA